MNMRKNIKENNKVVLDVVKTVETEYQVVMFRESKK